MSNLQTETESWLALDPDIEQSGKPLHEYVGSFFGKIALLWRRKWFLINAALIGLAIAVGISLLLPVKYTATLLLMPPDMNPMSGLDMMIGMKGGAGGLAGGMMGSQLSDVLGSKSSGDLYIQEMQSQSVEDNLIKRFGLDRIYGTKLKEDAEKALEGNTKIAEDRKSGIISIKVTDKDPNRAAVVANAYADEFGRLQSDLDSRAGSRDRQYFESQLVIARKQRDESSKALSDFSGKNGALNLPVQDTEIVTSIATVQRQLVVTEAELQGELSIYTEDNLRVKQMRAQIAELQRQLAQLQGKATSGAIDPRDPGRKSTEDSSPSQMKQLAGLSSEYMDLYLAAQSDQATVDTLTQQYEFAKLKESRHVADVQVLDPARVPERKTSPRRKQISLAGLLLGLLFAIAYILIGDLWHTKREDDEWKKLLRSCWSNMPWKTPGARSHS